MNELYDRIDQICKARGTNVTALCKEAGVSRATLSELKAGRTKTLSIETAQKLADSLQVSLNFLLGKFDDGAPISFTVSTSELRDYISNKKVPTSASENGLDEQDRQLMTLMKKLSADQKQFLLAQLLTLTEQEKNLSKLMSADASQPAPAPQEGTDTAPLPDAPETAPEGE